MSESSMLALSGFTMITAFMALIITKRISAMVGLVLVPLIFALLLGNGLETGGMMVDGIKDVAPTAAMLIFAIFYFGIMIDAGLFQPLVTRIVRWVGDDPLRAIVGQAALVSIVSLDGDGTTTLLVTVAALFPIYQRLGISPLIFATVGGLCGSIMNMTPWGGPAARAAAVLKVEPNSLFLPLIPAMAAGLAFVFMLAFFFGYRERRRAAGRTSGGGWTGPTQEELTTAFESDPAALRPKLIWFNFLMTAAMMILIVVHIMPIHAVFMIGSAIALMVNYPKVADQRARLLNHGGNILSVAILILAAGAFTGILGGTGMVDAMAGSIIANLPPSLGPHLGLVTAILSAPLTFFLPNDAFYFGILPIIAEAGQSYGIPPAEFGRASLMGLQIHGLSPLVAAVYLKCAIINIELADLQRFAFKYYIPCTCVMIATALLTGAISWGG